MIDTWQMSIPGISAVTCGGWTVYLPTRELVDGLLAWRGLEWALCDRLIIRGVISVKVAVLDIYILPCLV